MKIKNYKLVYDSDNDDYDVYTNDLESKNSNGYELGFIYLRLNEGWFSFLSNLTKVDLARLNPYERYKGLCKPSKTKKKAAKKLVKIYNKLLREMEL